MMYFDVQRKVPRGKWRSPTFFPQTRRDVDPDACLTEDIVSFYGERNELII